MVNKYPQQRQRERLGSVRTTLANKQEKSNPVGSGPSSNVEIKTGFWETVTVALFFIGALWLYFKTGA